MLVQIKFMSGSSIEIDSNFPGGNIVVNKIRKNTIFVDPDLRDTEGHWFYWYFAVRNAGGKKLLVKFSEKKCLGKAGPAISLDGGVTWTWDGRDLTNKNSFTYLIPGKCAEVRFCFAFPYLQTNWENFLKSHLSNPLVSTHVLCSTEKGRMAEYIKIGMPTANVPIKIIFTTRHHACEMMANYLLEGIIQCFLDELKRDSWVSEHIQILAIPFVDKDGVERGDQGKNRRPRDHNRDYEGKSLYSTIRAIRKLIPEWVKWANGYAFDLHCPYYRDDKIQFIGLPDQKEWEIVEELSAILEKENKGSLIYRKSDNVPFGQAWNVNKTLDQGKTNAQWAWETSGMRFATTLEFPYAKIGSKIITTENARLFGHNLVRSIINLVKLREK